MRILWYWPFARPEELDWARGVVRDGDEIVIQVIDRDGAPPAQSLPPVIVERSLPDVRRDVDGPRWLASRALTYGRRARRRAKAIESGGFDIVHFHYVNRFTDAVRAPARPWVLSVHDVLPHTPRVGPLERPIHRRLYSLPDALIVHHRHLADRLVSEFAVTPDRVHVVPHQVFPVASPSPLPHADVPTVLFFGALRENKGLDTLAAAIEMIDPGSMRFSIAGRGDRAMEQLVRDLGADRPNVDVEIGFVEQRRKNELFRQARAVVLPYSSFASQSGVLHDAYGHGRPVVVTDVGALGDTVREDGTGLVVPPRDARALADALERIVSADSVGQAGAALAIAEARRPSVIGEILRDVYDTLV